MNRIRRITTTVLGALALPLLLTVPQAQAANYPDKAIRIVVPFPPGGAVDPLARNLAEAMSRDLGQPVIIDNRAGGGTIIGSDAVAKADPDGYTILLTVSSLVQAPHLRSSVTLDPIKDFTPIAQVATTPLALVVRSDAGVSTPQELVAKVKAEPGKHTYGSYGAGSSGHLYMHAFTEQTGLDWVHAAYRGESPSVTDLIGGQLTAVIMSGVGAAPQIKGGKLTALAVTGPQRMPALPDVPTFEELGYTRMSTRGWFGLFGPAGMDPALVQTISDSAIKALNDPDVKQRIEALTLIVDPLPAAEFGPIVVRDNDYWSAIIKEVGVQLD